MVLGRCVDTNAAHIARWMTDHGLRVDGVSQVGDAGVRTVKVKLKFLFRVTVVEHELHGLLPAPLWLFRP